eukprot:TRINITY_DN3066_c0_g1_i3.p1 TRINITY_DN3066_c0_g1~~TRINITY_DN3066_c0_g1_i3.p1  ORF type:complete len:677 (+),score=359.09 TRINITY_DN3066_c0_g1_i3:103-2133(+)
MRAALALLALCASAHAAPTTMLKQQGELDDIWAFKDAKKNVTFSFFFTCTDAAACADATPSGGSGSALMSQSKLQTALNDAVNVELAKGEMNAKITYGHESPSNIEEYNMYAEEVFKRRPDAAKYLIIDRMVQSTAAPGESDKVYVKKDDADVEVTAANPDFWTGFVRATAVDVPNIDIYAASAVTAQAGDLSAAMSYEKHRLADQYFGTVIDAFEAAGTYKVHTSSVWISTNAELITDQLEPVPGRGKRNDKYLLPLLCGVASMLLVPIILTLVLVTLKKASRKEENWVQTLDKHVELMTTRNNAKQSEIDALRTSEEHMHKGVQKRQQEIEDRHAYDLLNDDDVDWADPDAVPLPPAPAPKEIPDNTAEKDAASKLLWQVFEAAALRKEYEAQVSRWQSLERERRHTLTMKPTGSLGIALNQDMTIKGIRPDSAADRAGFKVGDLIVGALIYGRGGAPTLYPIAKPGNMTSVIGPKFGVFEGTELEVRIIRDEDDKALFKARRSKLGDLGDEIDDNEARAYFKCLEKDDGSNIAPMVPVTMGAETENTIRTKRKEMQKMKDKGLSDGNTQLEKLDIDLLMDFNTSPEKAKVFSRQFFDAADADKSGQLSFEELKGVFSAINRDLAFDELNDEDAQRLFFLMDESNDEEVSFDEFFPYFRSDFLRRLMATLASDD